MTLQEAYQEKKMKVKAIIRSKSIDIASLWLSVYLCGDIKVSSTHDEWILDYDGDMVLGNYFISLISDAVHKNKTGVYMEISTYYQERG